LFAADKALYLQDYPKTHRLTPADAKKMLARYYDECGRDVASGSLIADELK